MFSPPFPTIPVRRLNPFSLKIGNRLLVLDEPKVMGIINITPDSFYNRSRHELQDSVLKKAMQMLSDGADILDIGGYSTRPGYDFVSEVEELKRVIPVISAIRSSFPNCLLSIDTFRSEVATAAVDNGANIVNDVSGGLEDPDMFQVVSSLKVPYIQMHIRSGITDMHQKQNYSSIGNEVVKELGEQIQKAKDAGITDIIADPGFGFSKNIEQNFQLLAGLENLNSLDLPLLVGLSRKSMVYKSLNINPEEALNGTTMLQTIALMKGVHILRVHDVLEAVQTIQLWKKLCLPES